MNYYIADTPGRLRIESPALKSGCPDAGKFQAFITAIPGVTSVEMKPIIVSATIHYDTNKIDHTRLIDILDKSGYFDHSHAKTPDQCLEEDIEAVTQVVVNAVEDVV